MSNYIVVCRLASELDTVLAWPRTDQVRLAIGSGRTQVVAGKGPMAMALRYCSGL
jgi:hypothetical protein